MANTGNSNNNGEPGWVQTLTDSIHLTREDMRHIRDDVRDMRQDMGRFRDDVDELKDSLGGRNGIRERLKEVELIIATLADRENTPVNIITSKKTTMREHGMTAGVAGAVVGLVEIALQFMKTK